MDIMSAAYIESLKRYWRRRRYKRLDDGKKRLKVARLGNHKQRSGWRMRLVRKLRFKVVSPMKLLAKFHGAYVDMLVRLVRDNNVGLVGEKKNIPRGRPVPVVSSRNEIVDGRLVLEIYNRLVSSRELSALLV